MTAAAIYLFYKTHKYYMWHKHSANYLDYTNEEQQARIASANKRNFGYNTRYVPTLPISKKLQMYTELGGPFLVKVYTI